MSTSKNEIGSVCWAEYSAASWPTDIPSLGINPASFGYVGQRGVKEFAALDYESVCSEGFSKCAGLIIKRVCTPEYIFAHLEPRGDSFFDAFVESSPEQLQRSVPTNLGPAEAVFVYGSGSIPQTELEGLMRSGRWGDIAVSEISLDTGNTHFGMVFRPSADQLQIYRKTPEHTIHTFQLFAD